MIIDNILVDWQSSKKVISFPTLVISFVRSYQFSDTCHSNNSSHISDQCGQKKFIYFCWPIIFYSWYIFWYHMGLGTSKNIIIYLWFTLNVMYPNEACYTYQFCEIFSILKVLTVCVTRPTGPHLGAIITHLGPVRRALHKFWGFEANMRQHEYAIICFRTLFCSANILVP